MTREEAATASDGYQRLQFSLPDFTRLSWVSDEAKRVWMPRIQRIGVAWRETEWASVSAGVRAACIVMMKPDESMVLATKIAKEGLSVVPLQMQGTTNYSYAGTALRYEPGRAFVFRAVVARPDAAAAFVKAYQESDEGAMGKLLGYPECCTRAFIEDWVERRSVDSTWFVAERSRKDTAGRNAWRVTGPKEANVLLRWLGLRAVSHLPCSFSCQPTVETAWKIRAVAESRGYAEEMEWAYGALDWSVQWSALHGIAIIKTPVVRITARTDATADRHVVERVGSGEVVEGATGIGFPFGRPQSTRAVMKARASVEAPKAAGPDLEPARENGFSSWYGMERAHEPIVALAASVIGNGGGSVVDLGCGNGLLMEKVRAKCDGVVVWGVDSNEKVIGSAHRRCSDSTARFVCMDIKNVPAVWPEARFTVVVVMPGRLMELDHDSAQAVRSWIIAQGADILAYAYGEWLTRYNGIRGLCAASGIACEDAAPVEGVAGISEAVFIRHTSGANGRATTQGTKGTGRPGEP